MLTAIGIGVAIAGWIIVALVFRHLAKKEAEARCAETLAAAAAKLQAAEFLHQSAKKAVESAARKTEEVIRLANSTPDEKADQIISDARRNAELESARIIGAARLTASEIMEKAEAEVKKQNLTWRQADHWAEKFRLLELKAEKEIARMSTCEMELLAAQNELDEARKSSVETGILKKSLYNVADRLIRDTRITAGRDLTENNYAATQNKLSDTFAFLSKNSVIVEDKTPVFDELRARFREVLRENLAREEQKRIKAMMREEIALQREREAELERLEAQEQAVRRALDTALARAKAEHSEEVDRLRERLAELDGAIVRVKSQAELTKAGHVYVLSNIGSFGEGVFKVGMTRRLEPLERVTELGDASVPFPFDVHMMISCEDAPALENALHRALNAHRLNKVNLRKEFFRTEIAELSRIVEAAHGKVEYIAEPAALQYRDSQSMTDADFAFVATEQSAALAEDLSEN